MAAEFLRHLETFEPLQPLLDKSVNLKTMAILDARIRSAKSGAAEAIQRM